MRPLHLFFHNRNPKGTIAHFLLFFENKNASFGSVGHGSYKKKLGGFGALNIGGYFTLSAQRPPRPAGSPSSSASSGLSDGVPRERECSPRTPLPAPVLAHVPVPAPIHLPPRTPMMDARRYRNLFPRRRVAPPTPPPSDDEPSDDGDGDDREDSQTASDASLSSQDMSSADSSYGSERKSTCFSSGPSDRSSSGSSSNGSSFGYGSVSGGSASDASSDDDLVNRYFAGTFSLSMP
ncbi:hypothetical protein PIB30_035275 [Stylosanthes scabra]|uniref:Uncharacterized protein n=1 Tax=Stylosanthes scabra TaxID=79078 RepID=A0ABU6XAM1_9FABA|nr:hypothetical protein [Stylosanthes scabra]